MTTHVRPALPSEAGDAEALTRLRLAWAAEKGAPLEDETFVGRFASWLATEADRRLFWVAEADDGAAVGMVNLMIFTRMPYPSGTDFKGAWGYLGNLFVDPAHRGRGIGAALIAACTAYAEANDLARIVLAPSEASVPLYARAGFVPATELLVRSFS